MNPNPASHLQQEITAVQNLLNVLKQEETLLLAAKVDAEALSRLTEEKAKAANAMATLAQARHDALKALGFEASENGMQAWLDSPAATDAERKTWNDLLELARSGNEANRVNGILIAQHLANNQNALNILQGHPQSGTVYGPDGQTSTKIGGRRLVVG